MFEFKQTAKLLGFARTGLLNTPHGQISTPVFMPVGTKATVKSLDPSLLDQIGSQIILANNYHLYLQPGSETIKRMGGIHQFSNWQKPILTDSGGFQVWSLRQDNHQNISSEGVKFKSHLDGSTHLFTPEVAIKSQIDIGADIIMAFDQCTSDKASKKEARNALDLTNKWLTQSIETWQKYSDPSKQSLFPIIQGAMHQDLRIESTQYVVSKNLSGIAVGGETIGYNMPGTVEVMNWIRPYLPTDKPIYTMGLGLKPSDLLQAIMAGADMFDCVAPTRLARNGSLYTGKVVISNNQYKFESEFASERLNIGNSRFKYDSSPIDSNCDCSTCSRFSRSYIHHLYQSKELLYYSLASVHNLRMMHKTVSDAIKLSTSHLQN